MGVPTLPPDRVTVIIAISFSPRRSSQMIA